MSRSRIPWLSIGAPAAVFAGLETCMNLAKIVVDGWDAAENTINSVIAFLKRNTPPAGQAALAAVGSDLKQGASDLIGVADSVGDQVLSATADSIVTVFNSAATAIGFAVGGTAGAAAAQAVERQLHPYEIDAINGLRDHMKAMLDAAALGLQAQLAGHPAVTAPITAPAASQAG